MAFGEQTPWTRQREALHPADRNVQRRLPEEAVSTHCDVSSVRLSIEWLHFSTFRSFNLCRVHLIFHQYVCVLCFYLLLFSYSVLV
jgi:hypothetical protein